MSGFTLRPPPVRNLNQAALDVVATTDDRPQDVQSEVQMDDMDQIDFRTVCASASKKASQYEQQLRDLESKLAEDLSNFRAINGLLQTARHSLQATTDRAATAVDKHVPLIERELSDSLEALSELAASLPKVREQVRQIRRVYDAGRAKAVDLVADLTFLNMPMHTRYAAIVFTATAPASWRKKALARSLAFGVFLIALWCSWLVIAGALRAHRHRLVWGERLLS